MVTYTEQSRLCPEFRNVWNHQLLIGSFIAGALFHVEKVNVYTMTHHAKNPLKVRSPQGEKFQFFFVTGVWRFKLVGHVHVIFPYSTNDAKPCLLRVWPSPGNWTLLWVRPGSTRITDEWKLFVCKFVWILFDSALMTGPCKPSSSSV